MKHTMCPRCTSMTCFPPFGKVRSKKNTVRVSCSVCGFVKKMKRFQKKKTCKAEVNSEVIEKKEEPEKKVEEEKKGEKMEIQVIKQTETQEKGEDMW